MAIAKTDDQNYKNIANAIRAATGRTETFYPHEMSDAILKIANHVTPEMFGAIGNGIADDSSAITQAIDSGMPIYISGKYLVRNIQTNKDIILVGDGDCCIMSDTSYGIRTTGKYISIGVNYEAVSSDAAYIVSVRENSAIIKQAEILANEILASTNGVQLISFIDCDYVCVEDINAHDISAYGDGNITNAAGSVYAVYCRDCNIVNANRFHGSNIHNVDSNGNIILEDASALYVTGDVSEFCLTNSDFKNCGKRAVKTQCKTAKISGCNFYTNQNDNLCILGIQDDSISDNEQFGIVDNCVFEDAYVGQNSGHYCLACSETLIVSNCIFKTAQTYNVMLNGKHTYNNCVFDSTVLIKSTGNRQKFYNCEIDELRNNNVETDIVEIHACSIGFLNALVEAYDSNIPFTVVKCTADSTTRSKLVNCHISSGYGDPHISEIRNPCDIINCTVWARSDSNARCLDIFADALIDGLRNINPDYANNKLGITFREGNITLKNCDIQAMWFYWQSSYTSTIKMYPSTVESLPANNHSFPNAYVFNMEDGKFYKHDGSAWAEK